MENINVERAFNKPLDVSKLYIGIYETRDSARIGLFKEDDIVSSIKGDHSYQFYKDVLSNHYVAMHLNREGKSIRGSYNVIPGNPKANWRGVIGTASIMELLDAPAKTDIIGEVDRRYGLIEFLSAIPDLKASVSLNEMVDVLMNFYSGINLREEKVREITKSLKSVPMYFESRNEELPIFINYSALKANEIVIPKVTNIVK